jgi:hypothetical protein
MIVITYYRALSAIEIDASEVRAGENEVAVNATGRSAFDPDPEKLPNDLVELYGCVISVADLDGKFPTISYPSNGISLLNSDQFLLFSANIVLIPDDVVRLSVTINNLSSSAVFAVPRPAKPYPSWSWIDGQWTPPAPYPNDGGRYSWDESSLGWGPV